jgi:uncharacterized protein (TIGR04255 family)
MRIKYKNPPINELVMGLYFKEPIVKFRSEHVGIYWSNIRDEFPKSAQNMMIGGVDIQVPNEIFPMPRFWFMTEDDVYLIQVQRNAFIFNWRRQKEEYPHYESLKKKFDKHFSKFEKFCKEQFDVSQIGIERCELSYINIISSEEYFGSFSDTKRVIPSFEPLSFGAEGASLKNFNLSYVYSANDDTTLTVNLQTRRLNETNEDALYFELKSSGALSQPTKSESDSWFERTHDVIGDAFGRLTNSDVQQQHWQPKED